MELKKVKLKKLFADLPVQIYGNKELEVSGLSSHSKTVSFGHLFVAREGLSVNGADFIEEAILGGAVAILCDLYNPFLKNVTQIVCKNPKELEGAVARRFFDPSVHPLRLIGLTGTNGKTTAGYLIRHLLEEEKTGLIGTIEYLIGPKSYPATLTTPDVLTNHKMLARMREAKLSYGVMEVTSHGLVQGRVNGIDFDIAAFTNLSQDHLDYHETMENYAQAKSLLFEGLKPKNRAIINLDDTWSNVMVQNCKAKIKTYGINQKADYQAKAVHYSSEGTSFDLLYENHIVPIQTKLVGKFNVYNTLVALAVALEEGFEIDVLKERLRTFKAPLGRLQSVENSLGFQVYIDFAHTEDALKNTLITLKEIPHKRLLTVFGCGGDRDQDKRMAMGRVVSELSDLTFVTSDNPRTEDPQNICETIYQGCIHKEKVSIYVDRKEAITQAIEEAKEGDLVLIAGRGHEPYQLIGRKRIPFLDAEVAAKILQNLSLKESAF